MFLLICLIKQKLPKLEENIRLFCTYFYVTSVISVNITEMLYASIFEINELLLLLTNSTLQDIPRINKTVTQTVKKFLALMEIRN